MAQPWVQTLGLVDFDAPAALCEGPHVLAGEDRPGRTIRDLTLREAVHMAMGADPRVRPFITVRAAGFPEVLDFDHIRGLHGHPDFMRVEHERPNGGATIVETMVVVGG